MVFFAYLEVYNVYYNVLTSPSIAAFTSMSAVGDDFLITDLGLDELAKVALGVV